MNKHLIEQLIVGRKHKKVQERQSALTCWSNWRWLDTRSLSQLEKLGGFSCIQKVLCGNKSRHFPNCGLEHSSRTRESHLCIDLSVLTARNQVTGLGYVIQTRKAWGEDLKTEGVQDQGSGLLADIVSQGIIAKMEGKPTWCTAENQMASWKFAWPEGP